MNPLSFITYYRRHKRQTLLLLGLMALMTLGVALMVGLLGTLPRGAYNASNYLTRVSLVSAVGNSLDPGTVSQIRTHPAVARVMQEQGLDIDLPGLTLSSHHFFGLTEADMQSLLEACELRVKSGRLPRPHSSELALTQEMASAMKLQLGDTIDRSIGEDWGGDNYYEAIPVPLELVGILEANHSGPETRLGLVSYEYVSNHEEFSSPWTPGLVLIPYAGRKSQMDRFLDTEVASSVAQVRTLRWLDDFSERMTATLYLICGVVDVLLTAVIVVVVGVINQLSQSQRLAEFGLLNALGYSRNQLIGRLMRETAGLAALGWLVGLVMSWALFASLDPLLQSMDLNLSLASLAPVWFTLPIPLVTTLIVTWNTRRTFQQLDSVAIVERGKLSMEAADQRQAVQHSSHQPLASLTYFLRHRRQGVVLVVAMGLMILGVSFPAFLFSPFTDAMKPFNEPLEQIAIVRPRLGTVVDSGVTSQVRVHASVERVIPAVELPVRVLIPPLGWQANFFGVDQPDMDELVKLFDLQMIEGRLPQPRSNEIVVSEAVALNRGWTVGDTVGGPQSERDSRIPTELHIAGLLAPVDSRAADPWVVFASREFLSNHERYANAPENLLVVPAAGQKATMDRWLRDKIHSDLAEVLTLEYMQHNFGLMTLILVGVFGLVESMVAVVAAVALAVLSYTFYLQRQEEFGVLHAIGRSRPWLVLRTIRETISTVGVAWLCSAVLCGLGLVLVKLGLYAPRGLALNFLNPLPWLFTLPIPLAVVAVSGGLVARMLRNLDPVAVIERR